MVSWNSMTWWLLPVELVSRLELSGILFGVGLLLYGLAYLASFCLAWSLISQVFEETDARDGHFATIAWPTAVFACPPLYFLWYALYLAPELRRQEERREIEACWEEALDECVAELDVWQSPLAQESLWKVLTPPPAMPADVTTLGIPERVPLNQPPTAAEPQVWRGPAPQAAPVEVEPLRGRPALSPGMQAYRETERRELIHAPGAGRDRAGSGAGGYQTPWERGAEGILGFPSEAA